MQTKILVANECQEHEESLQRINGDRNNLEIRHIRDVSEKAEKPRQAHDQDHFQARQYTDTITDTRGSGTSIPGNSDIVNH